MGNVFFIADTHFGHKNIVKFRGNGMFASVEEHDEFLVEKWNARVNKRDKVFHLGDFAFKNIEIAERLNGLKVLVMGNHDLGKPAEYAKHFHRVSGCLLYKKYFLSHVPVFYEQDSWRGEFNVHGHLHNGKLNTGKHINVCCDHIEYAPLAFEELETLTEY